MKDGMIFENSIFETTKHLKPLSTKAQINGKSFNRVFVDGDVVLNIMLLTTVKRLNKNYEQLTPTNMKKTSFMGNASHALGVLIADVVVGSKVTRYGLEGKPSYVVILGKDRIHTSECVQSILHKKLMIWISDNKVEVIKADQNPPFFAEVKMLEAYLFYSPHLGPISEPKGYEEGGVEACDLTKEGFKLNTLVDSWLITKSND